MDGAKSEIEKGRACETYFMNNPPNNRLLQIFFVILHLPVESKLDSTHRSFFYFQTIKTSPLTFFCIFAEDRQRSAIYE